MNLLVDIGNTRAKVALADEKGCVEQVAVADTLSHEVVAPLIAEHAIRHAILSTTRRTADEEVALLTALGVEVLQPDASTPQPIGIAYRTPETLGRDRVAAAVGAMVRYPKRNCLS